MGNRRNLIPPPDGRAYTPPMDRQLISELFAYVPMLYWPVLCLEIVKFHLWAWADAETHGYARQMIVAVNDHGRIRVRFIEDAPAEDWRAQLAACSAATSQLTTASPFDLIEGPISGAVSARMKLLPHQTLSPAAVDTEPPRPILDPG